MSLQNSAASRLLSNQFFSFFQIIASDAPLIWCLIPIWSRILPGLSSAFWSLPICFWGWWVWFFWRRNKRFSSFLFLSFMITSHIDWDLSFFVLSFWRFINTRIIKFSAISAEFTSWVANFIKRLSCVNGYLSGLLDFRDFKFLLIFISLAINNINLAPDLSFDHINNLLSIFSQCVVISIVYFAVLIDKINIKHQLLYIYLLILYLLRLNDSRSSRFLQISNWKTFQLSHAICNLLQFGRILCSWKGWFHLFFSQIIQLWY